MPKYRVLAKGMNLLSHSDDLPRVVSSGFYVTAFVDAASREAAESAALVLVRQSHVVAAADNRSVDPPRVAVEEVEEIARWPEGTARPLTGFALFDEGS